MDSPSEPILLLEGELMDSSACCVPGQSVQPLADERLKEVFLRDGEDPVLWNSPLRLSPSPRKRTHSEPFADPEDECNSFPECAPKRRTLTMRDFVRLTDYLSPAQIEAYRMNIIMANDINPTLRDLALTDRSVYRLDSWRWCLNSLPDKRTDGQGCSRGMRNGAAAGLPVTEDVPNPSSSGSIGRRKKRAAKASSGPARASSGPAKASSAPTKASMNCRSLPRGKRGLNVKSVTAKGSSTNSSQSNRGQKGKQEEIDEGAENLYIKERKRQKAEKERERRGNSKQLLEEVKSTLHAVCPLALGQKTSHQKVMFALLSVLISIHRVQHRESILLDRKHRILRRQKRVIDEGAA